MNDSHRRFDWLKFITIQAAVTAMAAFWIVDRARGTSTVGFLLLVVAFLTLTTWNYVGSRPPRARRK